MINLVSFSGGRTSAYMCHLLKKMNVPNLEFIFMDTGAEHPKTYEFIKKCDKHFNLNLKVLRPIVNPEMGKGMEYQQVTTDEMGWDLSTMKALVMKYGSFDYLNAHCTTMLKTRTAQKFIKSYDEDVTQWVGIRADEQRRLKDKKGFKYLADVSDMEKQDIIEFWQAMPFDLEIEQHLGNCVFCVKKNPNYIGLIYRDEPELFKQWVDMLGHARVRNDIDKTAIYRGKITPDGIVKMYENLDYDEMRQQLRMYKNKQTVCSESCEPFQMQMF